MRSTDVICCSVDSSVSCSQNADSPKHLSLAAELLIGADLDADVGLSLIAEVKGGAVGVWTAGLGIVRRSKSASVCANGTDGIATAAAQSICWFWVCGLAAVLT